MIKSFKSEFSIDHGTTYCLESGTIDVKDVASFLFPPPMLIHRNIVIGCCIESEGFHPLCIVINILKPKRSHALALLARFTSSVP